MKRINTTLKGWGRSWASGFAIGVVMLVISAGCAPKVVISPVEDPLWLEEGQAAPYEGWLITQGAMGEIIEGMK